MKLASRLLIILMLMIVGLAPSVGAGASNLNDGEPPQTPFSGSNTLYLPLVIRPPDFYSVSGQVSDVNSNPVSGVTILDKDGRLAVTNSQGQYSLMVPEGNNILVAGKEGLNFSPSALDVDVGPSTSAPSFMDTSALNFTALAACNEAVSNGGFEMGAASGQLWWNLPEYNLAYYIYPATRVSTPAHPVHSGSYSLRTGILIPTNNWYSYSDAISPPITIPSGITATLSLWRYPVSGEPPSLPLAELPDKSAFGQAPLATDAQSAASGA